ncbi:MAG TPA: YbhB/YbcL family Raf kinase inhibitor-like protein [Gemmatimonadaceae bacterium]|nr:YbhB/YbcL family Raf kinase inhibitor-like protein [Gemmatimonadaceae bacterium]
MIARAFAAVLASLLVVSVAAPLCAQGAPTASEPGASQLALANLPANSGAKLTVHTPAFAPGGDIPFENTQYKGNVFPGLSWSAGPARTKSYAIIMQDGDAMHDGAPLFHWSMVNIPPSVTSLAPGMKAPPAGATYGPNIRGTDQPYMGPHTPAGPKHRYHFQVFALDRTLPDAALANYAALTGAMKGHVLASGEVIGLGQVAPGASH